MKKIFKLSVLTFLLAWDRGEAIKRAKQAKKVKNPVIGVAWSQEGSGFLNGVQMALEEINEKSSGHQLQLDIKDDMGSVTQGLLHAEEFIVNKDVIAVIGHKESDITVPASTMYATAGLFMITPNSSAVELTSKNYEEVFRNIPNDRTLGRELVGYFKEKKKSKIMLCYVNSVYGRSLANEFETIAEYGDLVVKDRVSYDIGDEREFRKIAKKWSTFDFDSVMFIGHMPRGLHFIEVMRDSFPNIPIIMSESMVSKKLLEGPEEIVEGLVMPALFHGEKPKKKVKEFVEKYRAKYGSEPDQEAALGYDCMTLLGEAIISGESFVSSDIAKTFRSFENFEGVAQTYNFDESGDLTINERIDMQIIKNGKFTLERN